MMERVGDRWEKNGRILFDRPKPTVGCSASGRRMVRMGYLRTFVLRLLSAGISRRLIWLSYTDVLDEAAAPISMHDEE
jgi:hypothetical protein